MTIGVIISTYNNPRWLEKTLWGYLCQTRKPDEIIIADDGSTDDTRALINSFGDRLPIKHVWHQDRGFQKSEILNKALVASTADYLIFTDQDCVPRADFIDVHYRNAKKGHFLSGGYFKLTMDISLALTQDDIAAGRPFSAQWLLQHGQPRTFKMTKLLNNWFSRLMNHITPAKSTWNGCNSSGWRSDLLAVNGFNEDMHYGGQDRECGYRLENMGIKSIQMRYTAIVVHLDHKRPYSPPETIAFNKNVMLNTRKNKVVQTPKGIKK